jgi:predicted N-acetyltransferase YhbS
VNDVIDVSLVAVDDGSVVGHIMFSPLKVSVLNPVVTDRLSGVDEYRDKLATVV